MKNIKLFENRAQEFEILAASIKKKAAFGSQLNILEAGCGRRWGINLSGIDYKITGVDIDKKALEIRKNTNNDLDEIIEGDLVTVSLNENEYDVIYNSYVLEHIQNAELVLNNFYKWLKQGGLLILRIPDRNSVYGFITRVTPLWFHIFYKKYIFGERNAGKPGYGPYPTFHECVVSREGIRDFCKKNHFVIKEEYGQPYYIRGIGIRPIFTRLFAITVALLSFGKLQWKYNNLTYILEKE